MLKKLLIIATVGCCISVGLEGCAPGQNEGGATIAGIAAGGLAGGLIFGGDSTPAGIIGGALLGGLIGNMIGKRMDEQDRINMRQAIINTKIGNEARWTNRKTDVTYEVRPTKQYHRQGRYCREYQTRVKIGGKWKQAYGKACRQPDGSWKMIS